VIVEREDGRFDAAHIPTRHRATFDSQLGAMTWMIVMDDRFGTRGWVVNLNCLFEGTEPLRPE
jgi:hypothetical protein